MRKIRKDAGCMHSIKSDSFRARPRNQNFIGDEYEDGDDDLNILRMANQGGLPPLGFAIY